MARFDNVFRTAGAVFLALAAVAQAGDPFGQVPICFEPNLGQGPAEARFVARGPGYSLLLGQTQAVLHRDGGAVRMALLGSNAKALMRAEAPLPGKSNYLRGRDPRKWIQGVPHAGKVVCEGVYEGIDLIYYGNPRELEFDFVVAPDADPDRIRIKFDATLRIDANGALRIEGAPGTVTLKAPVLSQGKERVEGGFVLLGAGEVGFHVGRYDPAKPLVIDPVLVYSTYLGGSDATGPSENCNSIAVDDAGCAYATGITQSLDFPTANPFQPQNNSTTAPIKTDAFVTKSSADGSSLVYSTYLGGDNLDVGRDIVVDSGGCAYVVGGTRSSDFPTANALQAAHGGGVNDGFLAKLSASGASLVYSTYLGGSGDDTAHGVAIDSAGRAHVTGVTVSTDFPTANPHQPSYGGGNGDVFVAKFEADGSALVYSTYLGGGGTGSGADVGYEIAVDASGNAVAVGWTFNTNFPTVNPVQSSLGGGADVLVARFSGAGACTFATFLGGSGADYGKGVAIDASGSVYVTGETVSANFPTSSGAYQGSRPGGTDAFVTKLNVASPAIVYSTYFGTSSEERGFGIAVDGSGNAHLVGTTNAPKKFPLLNPVQSKLGGAIDLFVTKFNATGSGLVYSTYLGGKLSERDQAKIALGGDGATYVCGLTASTDFPTVNAFQATRRGVVDGFVAKISP